MDDLCDMTLDKFKLWTTNALRVFLSRRNKSVNGNFEELSARAFCAWEENLPVNEKAEQIELRLLEEYKTKLKIEGDVVPDQFSLTSGWKGEKTAMSSWPSIYITDISTYLKCSTPKEVVHRLLNEYKEGKGYRYFDCEWVKEIYLHNIRPNCDKCLLKAKVTPSQSVNNKNYDVWLIVRKDSTGRPGGEILGGYCSCTAGMLGTCNHIAGVLFRVEHAVKTGTTKTTSTSKLCEWNIPKNKTTIKPVKVTETPWKKGYYSKKSTDNDKEKETLTLKNAFTPLSKTQHNEVQDQECMRERLYHLVKEDVPNSCFVLLQEKRRIHAPKLDLPPALIETAEFVKKDNVCNESELKEKFKCEIKLSAEQCRNINRATKDQSSSQTWIDQRKGRITASNFQRVSTRVNTLRKDPNADPTALVKTIIGRNEIKPTMAMKHGLSTEPSAKKAYTHLMKKTHKKFKSSDSGLSICQDQSFIGASADLEVECLCCGKGLCEIKCPETIKDSIPSDQNVPYLTKENNDYVLNKSHPYYFQIQGQMAILGREYCDFFVYTFHGHVLLRVLFDKAFWEALKEKLVWFWENCVLTELLKTECTPGPINDIENIRKDPPTPLKTTNCERRPLTPEPHQPLQTPGFRGSKVRRALNPILPSNQAKKCRKTTKKQPIYLCGCCGFECSETPQNEEEQSVNCDTCSVWVHYACAKVNDEQLSKIKEWTCSKCI